MGLYDIAYMLAVPGHDGHRAEGRRRADRAAAHRASRTPTDRSAPAIRATRRPPSRGPSAEVPAVPYGTWEQLRSGRDVAILAVGTMVQPGARRGGAARRRGDRRGGGQLPVPQAARRRHARVGRAATSRLVVTVEEGTVVNGFGAISRRELQTPTPRCGSLPRRARPPHGAGAARRAARDVRAHRRRDRAPDHRAPSRGELRGAMNVGVVGNPRYAGLAAVLGMAARAAQPRHHALHRARLEPYWPAPLPHLEPAARRRSTRWSPSAATAPCSGAPACSAAAGAGPRRQSRPGRLPHHRHARDPRSGARPRCRRATTSPSGGRRSPRDLSAAGASRASRSRSTTSPSTRAGWPG